MRHEFHFAESTLDIECGRACTVRLWIEEEELYTPQHSEYRPIVEAVRDLVKSDLDLTRLLKELAGIVPGVTAVQVSAPSRMAGVRAGVVVYTVPFDHEA